VSGFKASIEADLHRTFLNTNDFGELCTIVYDGQTYRRVPTVLTGLKEKDRRAHVNDHAQGLFRVSRVLHCALADLGGNQPEVGQRIRIGCESRFLSEFYVASSTCDLGMLRVELEEVDE